MKYNLYSVYKGNELLLEDVPAKEVNEFTGCCRNSVSRYAKRGERVKGIYTVKITGEVERTAQHENDAYKAFARRYGIKLLREWLVMNQKYGTH